MLESTKTDYTEGPWSFRENPHCGDVIAANGDRVASVCAPGMGAGRKHFANGYLLSASMDMLDVLLDIIDYHGGADSALHDDYIMGRAYAAVAKARGIT